MNSDNLMQFLEFDYFMASYINYPDFLNNLWKFPPRMKSLLMCTDDQQILKLFIPLHIWNLVPKIIIIYFLLII